MKRALFAAALLPLLAAPGFGQEAVTGQADTRAAQGAADPQDEPAAAGTAALAPIEAGDIPGLGGTDPWAGIVIVVTPQPEQAAAASEPAGRADQAAPMPAAWSETSGQPEPLPDPEVAEAMDGPMPSLWTSLDLALGDDLPGPPARKVTIVPTRRVKSAPAQPMPTKFDLQDGPARFAVVTNVSTTRPVSAPLAAVAGGGSGEVKGRVGYVLDNWSVYGVGGFGASESTGSVSVYDSLVLGGTYSMPLAPFGFGPDDRLGAKIEVGDTEATTTSLEMRSGQGNYQRFISVERSTAPEASTNDIVRAGVIGKF